MTETCNVNLRLEVFEDRYSISITLPQRPSGQVETVISGPGGPTTTPGLVVQEVMTALGMVRTGLSPAVAERWDGGQGRPIENVYRDPACVLETDALGGDSLLHIRDERFGWLHFIFSKPKAKKLGEKLIAQAALPPPAASGSA